MSFYLINPSLIPHDSFKNNLGHGYINYKNGQQFVVNKNFLNDLKFLQKTVNKEFRVHSNIFFIGTGDKVLDHSILKDTLSYSQLAYNLFESPQDHRHEDISEIVSQLNKIQFYKDMYQKLLDLLYPQGFDPYKVWEGLDKFPTENTYKHTNLSIEVIDEALQHTSSNFWMEIGSMYGGSAIKASKRCLEKGRDMSIFCVDPFCGDTSMWIWNKENSQLSQAGNLPLGDVHLDTLGIRPRIMEKFLGNIIESGLQKYILPLPSTGIVGMRVIEILLEQKKIEEGPGIMYIDSSHEWDETYTELKTAWRILAPGGIMMGDDFNWKSVRYEVERFARDFGAVVEERENFQWIIKKPQEIGYIPSPFWTIN